MLDNIAPRRGQRSDSDDPAAVDPADASARCPSCGWLLTSGVDQRSRHPSSAGAVTYCRCVCGRYVVLVAGAVVTAVGDGW